MRLRLRPSLGIALLLSVTACGGSTSIPAGTAAPAVAPPASASPTTAAVAPATTATPTTAGAVVPAPATTAAPAAVAPVTMAAPVVAPVPALLNFAAPKVGGGTLSGADFAGKPVAFWFWAPT